MGSWEVSAGIAVVLIGIVVGAVANLRLRSARRDAAERRRREEEVLREESLDRLWHIQAQWEGREVAAPVEGRPGHPDPGARRVPADHPAARAPREDGGLDDGAGRDGGARPARAVVAVAVLVLVAVVAVGLVWFTSR